MMMSVPQGSDYSLDTGTGMNNEESPTLMWCKECSPNYLYLSSKKLNSDWLGRDKMARHPMPARGGRRKTRRRVWPRADGGPGEEGL